MTISAFRFVALGGLVAGVLDIVFACAFWWLKAGVPVQRILQSVAAGVLGKASFADGARTAALGLSLHLLIALCMSFAYFVVARHWPALWQRPFVFGSMYGLVLYVVMNFVVVPLSAAMPASKDPLWIVLSIVAHVVLVGIPCAWFTQRAFIAGQ